MESEGPLPSNTQEPLARAQAAQRASLGPTHRDFEPRLGSGRQTPDFRGACRVQLDQPYRPTVAGPRVGLRAGHGRGTVALEVPELSAGDAMRGPACGVERRRFRLRDDVLLCGDQRSRARIDLTVHDRSRLGDPCWQPDRPLVPDRKVGEVAKRSQRILISSRGRPIPIQIILQQGFVAIKEMMTLP